MRLAVPCIHHIVSVTAVSEALANTGADTPGEAGNPRANDLSRLKHCLGVAASGDLTTIGGVSGVRAGNRANRP